MNIRAGVDLTITHIEELIEELPKNNEIPNENKEYAMQMLRYAAHCMQSVKKKTRITKRVKEKGAVKAPKT